MYSRVRYSAKWAAAAISLGLLVANCTSSKRSDTDPKARLSEYISKTFSVRRPEDRQELLTYLTGDAKARLSAWSDEQFRQAFIESKRQLGRLLIREIKNISSQEVSMTYELTYVDQSRGKNAKVTNKKLCTMILDNGKWYIKNVKNIQETVEYQNEMSLP